MTDRRVYISKSGMTGTGTDTRMYSPRSESSHMYRNNLEPHGWQAVLNKKEI